MYIYMYIYIYIFIHIYVNVEGQGGRESDHLGGTGGHRKCSRALAPPELNVVKK